VRFLTKPVGGGGPGTDPVPVPVLVPGTDPGPVPVPGPGEDPVPGKEDGVDW